MRTLFFLKDDVPGMLTYSLTVCMSLLQSRQFRNKVSSRHSVWHFQFVHWFIFFFRAGIHVLCVVFRGLNVSYQNGSINRLFAQCPGDYLNIGNIISLSYAKIIQNPPFIGDLFYTCDCLWNFLLLMQWVCHLLNLSCW